MKYGCFLKRCGDGSDGKMVLMYFSLISQKRVGTIFQIVDLMLNKTQDKVSTIQSMFTTTTFTLMSMSNQDKPEELQAPMQVNSFQRVSSMTRADGEFCK
jgi:hypothetical protein